MKQSAEKNNRLPIFTQRFRELQGSRTNTEFAKILGMSRQTVGFYCNGDRIPDAVALRQIAESCSVSVDWLLGLSEFETQTQSRYATNLSDKIIDLMKSEFDDGDRRRVETALLSLISGFKDSRVNYECYTNYENDVMRVLCSLNSTSLCINAATRCSEGFYSEQIENSVCEAVDAIINDAASNAYAALGYFFTKGRTNVFDLLEPTFYQRVDLSFAGRIAEIEHMLNDNQRKE